MQVRSERGEVVHTAGVAAVRVVREPPIGGVVDDPVAGILRGGALEKGGSGQVSDVPRRARAAARSRNSIPTGSGI
jgi:hypothetical protein